MSENQSSSNSSSVILSVIAGFGIAFAFISIISYVKPISGPKWQPLYRVLLVVGLGLLTGDLLGLFANGELDSKWGLVLGLLTGIFIFVTLVWVPNGTSGVIAKKRFELYLVPFGIMATYKSNVVDVGEGQEGDVNGNDADGADEDDRDEGEREDGDGAEGDVGDEDDEEGEESDDGKLAGQLTIPKQEHLKRGYIIVMGVLAVAIYLGHKILPVY